jgi:hypothetical protein
MQDTHSYPCKTPRTCPHVNRRDAYNKTRSSRYVPSPFSQGYHLMETMLANANATCRRHDPLLLSLNSHLPMHSRSATKANTPNGHVETCTCRLHFLLPSSSKHRIFKWMGEKATNSAKTHSTSPHILLYLIRMTYSRSNGHQHPRNAYMTHLTSHRLSLAPIRDSHLECRYFINGAPPHSIHMTPDTTVL